MFEDSIIQDVSAEKAQDMAEVGVTMHAWEYRMKWYGEDEKTAKAGARGLKASGDERVQWPLSKQDNPYRMHRRLYS